MGWKAGECVRASRFSVVTQARREVQRREVQRENGGKGGVRRSCFALVCLGLSRDVVASLRGYKNPIQLTLAARLKIVSSHTDSSLRAATTLLLVSASQTHTHMLRMHERLTCEVLSLFTYSEQFGHLLICNCPDRLTQSGDSPLCPRVGSKYNSRHQISFLRLHIMQARLCAVH